MHFPPLASSPHRTLLLALLATLGTSGLTAGAADAGTVKRTTSGVSYVATAGETNAVTATVANGNLVFQDPGAPAMTDGDGAGGCAVSGGVATCSTAGVTRVDVDLGDRDDRAEIATTFATVIKGGTGADTLLGGSGADQFYGGDGDDAMRGNAGADVIRGEGGLDTASYATSTAGEVADLDGTADDGSADDGPVGARDRIMTDVERLRGGTGADRLTGNSAANRLTGDAGSDTLTGGSGDDALDGGSGNDTIRGEDGTDRLQGGSSDDALSGGTGPDAMAGGTGVDRVSYSASTEDVSADLEGDADDGSVVDGPVGARDQIATDVEDLRGGAGDDTLRGDARANVLTAYAGDDVLVGGAGSDEMSGGDGRDRVSYAGSAQSETLTLDDARNDGSADDGPEGARDRIRADVEDLTGGDAGDSIQGDGGPNRLWGGAGGDVLDGRAGDDEERGGDDRDVFYQGGGVNGRDLLDGEGGGEDLAYYISRTQPVDLSLDDQPNDGESGEADDIRAVEALFGGSGNDRLAGDGRANELTGYDGNDTLIGGDEADRLMGYGGDDVLAGNGGPDRMDGGYGADDEYGDGGDDTFTATSCGDCGDANDEMWGGEGTDLLDFSYRVVSVDVDVNSGADQGQDANFDGNAEEDDAYYGIESVTGSTQRDRINADDGSGRIEGRDGNDLIRARGGDDTVLGGEGNDSIEGMGGADTIRGGAGDDLISEGYESNGGDDLQGDDGWDTIDYSSRTIGVGINLNGAADDGQRPTNAYPTPENDDVASDFERYWGSAGHDGFWGTSSTDRFNGFAGSDYVIGNGGDDELDGGADIDELHGGGGNDALNGGTEQDRIYGEDGNDVLHGNDGDDDLEAGTGDDQYFGDAGDDSITEGNAANGADTISCGSGGENSPGGFVKDRLDYNAGSIYDGRTVAVYINQDGIANDGQDADFDKNAEEDDNVMPDCEAVWGGNGNDFFEGTAGADNYVGMLGNDGFRSNGGADYFEGREGDDVFLIRDGAKQVVWGGSGNDTAQSDWWLDSVNEVP